MPTLTVTWGQVALICILVLAVYAIEMAFFYWRLRQHHFTEHLALVRLRQVEKTLEVLQRQMYPEPRATSVVDVPLEVASPGSLKKSPIPSSVIQVPVVLQKSSEADGAASYNRAIDLAREGANAQQLSRECGLSRGEADLIVSLYGAGERR